MEAVCLSRADAPFSAFYLRISSVYLGTTICLQRSVFNWKLPISAA